jgi:lipopolysaccharide/colanic/teichoic acid biosynthesis glycosyltransferase
MKEPLYKRPLDLTVLLLAHLFLLPLWLLLWTVIPLVLLLDDGFPLFYRQRRMGRNGQVFGAIKFRTMVRNAEQMGWATSENDPRLTKAGRILRKTALDELPQVINILRGEMSFVGPRALAESEHEFFREHVPDFDKRLIQRPGLTGMAQVYANRDDAEEKLSYDINYSKRMSLWMDIKLLFLSVWVTLRGRWESRGEKL